MQIQVSATVIVISKDMKALVLQRRPDEKVFPSLWTVAGGKMEDNDGVNLPLYPEFYYSAGEVCAQRELFEETGIAFAPFNDFIYLTSILAGRVGRMILSYYLYIPLDADEIEIKLSESAGYTWITKEEVDKYNFIPDIGGEIKEVFEIFEKNPPVASERMIDCIKFAKSAMLISEN
jgi:8-oxo-dGTP pyrophosphatase MutT (NUDIX family)